MDNSIHTAIVGYGLSGEVFHAPLIDLHPGFTLTKVVERHSDKSKQRYPDVVVAKDFYDIVNDDDTELVVICTPNIHHFDMAKACLEAGKHVVIEKPFMPASAEADEIIQLSKEKNRKVFVYQNRRWDGDFLTIKKILSAGILGDIQYFEAHFDRYSPERKRAAWRDEQLPGSGILFDLGSHLIDQAVSLFGLPDWIKADIQSQREGSLVDDYFEVTLGYEEMTAVVTAGMLVENPELRYIVNGSRGSYIKYGIDPQEGLLKQGVKPEGEEWGIEEFENWGLLSCLIDELHFDGSVETLPGNYMGFYQNVYEVLKGEGEMQVSPEQAMDVIRIIELAFESSHTKKEVTFNK
jgi:scyllo-inositol 2-dehydrogenase (NADP+)